MIFGTTKFKGVSGIGLPCPESRHGFGVGKKSYLVKNHRCSQVHDKPLKWDVSNVITRKFDLIVKRVRGELKIINWCPESSTSTTHQ